MKMIGSRTWSPKSLLVDDLYLHLVLWYATPTRGVACRSTDCTSIASQAGSAGGRKANSHKDQSRNIDPDFAKRYFWTEQTVFKKPVHRQGLPLVPDYLRILYVDHGLWQQCAVAALPILKESAEYEPHL
jgi:hypothetical protein